MYLVIDVDALGIDRTRLTPAAMSQIGALADVYLAELFNHRNAKAVATWIKVPSVGGRTRVRIAWQGIELTEDQRADMVNWFAEMAKTSRISEK